MLLTVVSDDSHLSKEKRRLYCQGYLHLSNKGASQYAINASILAICSSIPTVCGAASETEYTAFYINAQHVSFEHTVLEALGYFQLPIHLYADNMAAVGISQNTLLNPTAQKLLPYAMRYH